MIWRIVKGNEIEIAIEIDDMSLYVYLGRERLAKMLAALEAKDKKED